MHIRARATSSWPTVRWPSPTRTGTRLWDAYEKAVAEDPTDVAYQIAIKRVRFQAAQMHVNAGGKLRTGGELDKALAEFQKAYAIDPSSDVAEQNLRRRWT